MKRKTIEESYVVFGRVYYGFEPTESHFFSAFRCTLVLRHHQRGRKLFVTFQRSSVNIILPRVCPRFMKMYALEKSWISYEKFKETLNWKTRTVTSGTENISKNSLKYLTWFQISSNTIGSEYHQGNIIMPATLSTTPYHLAKIDK